MSGEYAALVTHVNVHAVVELPILLKKVLLESAHPRTENHPHMNYL
jgi:hypothetical protein